MTQKLIFIFFFGFCQNSFSECWQMVGSFKLVTPKYFTFILNPKSRSERKIKVLRKNVKIPKHFSSDVFTLVVNKTENKNGEIIYSATNNKITPVSRELASYPAEIKLPNLKGCQ